MLSAKKWLLYGICGMCALLFLSYALARFGDSANTQAAAPEETVAVPSVQSGEETVPDSGRNPPGAEEVAPEATDPVTSKSREAPQEPEMIFAGIQGAVKEPGYYSLEEGQRIHHLIEAAGGLADNADIHTINLAAWVLDGTTLFVPAKAMARQEGDTLVMRGGAYAATQNRVRYTRRGWRPYWNPNYQAWLQSQQPDESEQPTSAGAAQRSSGAVASADEGRININTASKAQLESLPGIGPVMAGNIMDYRELAPFGSIEEVMNVSGIGEKRFEAIRAQITVGQGAP